MIEFILGLLIGGTILYYAIKLYSSLTKKVKVRKPVPTRIIDGEIWIRSKKQNQKAHKPRTSSAHNAHRR